jgi:hypothetical protein
VRSIIGGRHAGRPYSEPGALRIRRSPAIDLPRIAMDVEDAVPYEINLAKRKKEPAKAGSF